MGIFNFGKNRGTEKRSMTDLTVDMTNVLESTLKDCLKIADVDAMDFIGELDETSGAVLGRCIRGTKDMMKLVDEFVAIADRQNEQIDTLVSEQIKTNEMLMKICESMS